ncbi:hypothetical protein N656DRAFT_783906 [Canariomyces notabilis]|uniref:Uncharacterized protein n=1 Tax=Canariomyces notabilis TaxID=2074819 RepID=A0AAN6QH48_9PEZI|nr:hypothetical protein N656DRAFT_783906 [Canariomyces arenarius]
MLLLYMRRTLLPLLPVSFSHLRRELGGAAGVRFHGPGLRRLPFLTDMKGVRHRCVNGCMPAQFGCTEAADGLPSLTRLTAC